MIRVLLAFCLLIPVWARAADPRWALLVGANDGGPGTAPLLFAGEDAEKLQAVFVQLGSVPESQARTLLDPRPDQLLAAIERLRGPIAAARARGEHTTLLFFYSGHADGEGLRLGRARLGHEALREALEAAGADVQLTFLDACQSGSGNRHKGAARAPAFLPEPELRTDTRGSVTITSSAADEISQESDEIGGSWFTHHLLSALRGDGDSSGDGRVTLEEAYRHVYHRTVEATAATRAGVQHPGFDYDLVGVGDIVLTQLGVRGAALIFPGDLLGRFLIFDDDRHRFVAEVQATPGRPSRLLLQAGRYRVQKRGAEGLLEQRLRLGDGDEGQVDESNMRSLRYAEDTTKGAVTRVVRRSEGRAFRLSVKGGIQGFFDPEIQAGLIPAMPMIGVEADLEGLLSPFTSLRFDLLLGVRDTDAAIDGALVPVRFAELHGGLGPYLVAVVPGARWFRPFLGLRVSAIWLHRDFLPPLHQDGQDWFMVTPGAAGGVTFRLDQRLALSLEARAHLMLYIDEDGQHGLGHGEALLGLSISW